MPVRRKSGHRYACIRTGGFMSTRPKSVARDVSQIAHSRHARFARRAKVSQPSVLAASGKSQAASRPSRLVTRGVSRSSRNVRREMRWTRRCRKTNGTFAYGEAVWSRRPDAGVKFGDDASHRADDGGKKARSPRRARNKPSNHRAGDAGLPPLNLYAHVRFPLR